MHPLMTSLAISTPYQFHPHILLENLPLLYFSILNKRTFNKLSANTDGDTND